MEQHINITLRLKDRDVDIRIPRKIEVRRLIREIDTIFNPGIKRKKYQLRIVNKGKHLSDYPMTTGDLVEIEEI